MNSPIITDVKRLAMILPFILATSKPVIAQRISMHPTEIIYPIAHDISPKLIDIPIIQSDSGKSTKAKTVPNPSFSPVQEGFNNLVDANAGLDPVLQSEAGVLHPNTTIVNFDGINNKDGYWPPDPAGDVGPNHYIQAVNTSFAIYSKTGDLMYGPTILSTLWAGLPHIQNDGDPIVLYDHLADRWIITQFSLPNFPNGPFYELIAISQTADPLGAWYRYTFQFDDMPDYPKLAVWPDGYYMSTRRFSSGSLNWLGPSVAVFERDSMLVGNTARMASFNLPSGKPEILPADLDGQVPPAGSPGYFISQTDGVTDRLDLYKLHTDWIDSANAVFEGPQNISTVAFDGNMCSTYGGSCIPQKGSSQKLDPLSPRLMNRLQYRNFGSYEAIVANGTVDADNTDHAGIRWYELRTNDTTWYLYQQGTYAPDTNHRWMGSISMDGNGNIALAYSVSGIGMYPSIRATARRSGDTLGLMTYAEESIIEGAGAQTCDPPRWGDYSSLTVDPVDDRTFWYTNEYYASTSSSDWRTRIASFTIDDFPVGMKENPVAESGSAFKLMNYPNPVKSSTTISWQMQTKSPVILKLYNYTGCEIRTLVHQVETSGYHQVVFEPAGLPAGVYFYQLQADGRVETKKMIVCR